MKRIQVNLNEHNVQKNLKLEQYITSQLLTNDEGRIIYKGTGPVADRIGSPLRLLIDFVLYEEADEKPLDTDYFRRYLIDQLNLDTRNKDLVQSWTNNKKVFKTAKSKPIASKTIKKTRTMI